MFAEGKMPLVYTERLRTVQVVAMLELFGFAIIFTCMVLMRFGL